ncbi:MULTISPECIES: type II toxin-antitoxin system RelE/ParE family toxin [Arenicella]|uniref:Addiction module RelE/StbE family toxin n=2 Tax=Arenicella TaxID=904708 RepID=A0A395JGW6_9GAMM|nr:MULTISPECIES: type II toxin-antitoxin system RelE/ParE family toxin [Arenicella]RBP47028.1 addiction module RelE/StbE family toxin [Arenicella xantha]GHA21995.1 plasmid stabilization protein [Arenicella chitinivorans]
MVKIVWTDSALDDLDEIAEYIALDKIGAAKKLIQKIFSKVDLLADQPELGRMPPELQGENYREIIVGPCRVFYRVLSEEVVILYVMRSERLLRMFILEERGKTEN